MKAHKIVVLGDFGVGKTSLIRRYVLDQFSDQYRATLGVHLYKHTDTIAVEGMDREVRLVLWDIEGAPLPGEQMMRYALGASGAIIVGDLTRDDMTAPMRGAADMVEARLPGRPISIALNKSDIAPAPDDDLVATLRDRYGASIALTSAKTGDEVPRLFHALGQRIVGAGDGAV
jgi:GTPase SAR1 family protein